MLHLGLLPVQLEKDIQFLSSIPFAFLFFCLMLIVVEILNNQIFVCFQCNAISKARLPRQKLKIYIDCSSIRIYAFGIQLVNFVKVNFQWGRFANGICYFC